MICPQCEFENQGDAKFCNKCGARLELCCSECGTPNLPGSRFCKECGSDLTKPSESSPVDYTQPQSYTPKFLAEKILTTRSSIEGERKLVTVLFADVVNHTSIAEKLDPDKLRKELAELPQGVEPNENVKFVEEQYIGMVSGE